MKKLSWLVVCMCLFAMFFAGVRMAKADDDSVEKAAGTVYTKWTSVCYHYETYEGRMMAMDRYKIYYRNPGDDPRSTYEAYCQIYVYSKSTTNLDTGETIAGSHICLKDVGIEIVSDAHQEVSRVSCGGEVFKTRSPSIHLWEARSDAESIQWPYLSFAEVIDLEYDDPVTIPLDYKYHRLRDAASRKARVSLPSCYRLYQQGDSFRANFTLNNNGAGHKKLYFYLTYTSGLCGIDPGFEWRDYTRVEEMQYTTR